MPCVGLAFVLKQRNLMVLLALRFGLACQLITPMQSHDKMASSSSTNSLSSNRDGQK